MAYLVISANAGNKCLGWAVGPARRCCATTETLNGVSEKSQSGVGVAITNWVFVGIVPAK